MTTDLTVTCCSRYAPFRLLYTLDSHAQIVIAQRPQLGIVLLVRYRSQMQIYTACNATNAIFYSVDYITNSPSYKLPHDMCKDRARSSHFDGVLEQPAICSSNE